MSERIIHATVANFDELVKKMDCALSTFGQTGAVLAKCLLPLLNSTSGKQRYHRIKGRR